MVTDDIVTRLREGCSECGLHALYACTHEAADEIERLRANLKQWQALCDTYYAKLVMETDNTSYFIQGYRFLASGGK